MSGCLLQALNKHAFPESTNKITNCISSAELFIIGIFLPSNIYVSVVLLFCNIWSLSASNIVSYLHFSEFNRECWCLIYFIGEGDSKYSQVFGRIVIQALTQPFSISFSFPIPHWPKATHLIYLQT